MWCGWQKILHTKVEGKRRRTSWLDQIRRNIEMGGEKREKKKYEKTGNERIEKAGDFFVIVDPFLWLKNKNFFKIFLIYVLKCEACVIFKRAQFTQNLKTFQPHGRHLSANRKQHNHISKGWSKQNFKELLQGICCLHRPFLLGTYYLLSFDKSFHEAK